MREKREDYESSAIAQTLVGPAAPDARPPRRPEGSQAPVGASLIHERAPGRISTIDLRYHVFFSFPENNAFAAALISFSMSLLRAPACSPASR